jgi:SAM-dependent methyltransferase
MTLEERDRELARKYGGYASFTETDGAPILTKDWGDSAADEIDRLLDRYTGPESIVLDLGCGAGQTLCRLAPCVHAIYGFDQEEDLLTAARERSASRGTTNATFLLGNVSKAEDVAELPDATITLAFSRRGPNLTGAFLPKLVPDALLVQELVSEQDAAGLKEIFGRKPFLPRSHGDADWLIGYYGGLEMLPVSAKSFWSEQYFRDAEHLALNLTQGATLSNWWMPPLPYEPERDRAALELYARYNRTLDGIRVLRHRRVYVFRRARVNYYPADHTI